MLIHYLTLGLALEATDDEIRNRYLQLVKDFPPEKNPYRFQSINKAYEVLKDKRNRVRAKLFMGIDTIDYENGLRALKQQVPFKKKAVGLRTLIEAMDEKI